MNIKIKVELTQEDIDNGKREQCQNCPGALAINRALKKYKVFVSVSSWIFIYDNTNGLVIGWAIAPKELNNFIRDFDEFRDVKPFNFELDVKLPDNWRV